MLPIAQSLQIDPPTGGADYTCSLTYEERFLRRRKLSTDCGKNFVVDLPKTTDLKQGDHLLLSNEETVEILAKQACLARLAGPTCSENEKCLVNQILAAQSFRTIHYGAGRP